MNDYWSDVQFDAREMAEEFISDIVDQLESTGEASCDLYNDYPDGDAYHHECHVDKDYSLLEAATLLSQLSEYEETDGGLWEGVEPIRAVCIQAAYTYGNAVYFEWIKIIEHINSEFDADNGEYIDDPELYVRELIV